MPRSTYRSVSYDLDAAVALARCVAASGDAVPSDDLAPLLGYSGTKNGAFLTRLANARLFGLVSGSSGRVALTDRGRAVVAGGGPGAGRARAEAFLSVPLFRVVVERLDGQPVPYPAELASLLASEFGERPSKSATSAVKLLDSARQSGLIRRDASGIDRLSSIFTGFTDFADGDGQAIEMAVRSSARWRELVGRAGRHPHDKRKVGAAMDEHGQLPAGGDSTDAGVWLADPPDGSKAGRSVRRTAAIVAAAAVCIAVVAVPIGLAVTSGGGQGKHQTATQSTQATHDGSQAAAQVLSALSATTDSGSFDFTYSLSSQASTAATTTTTATPACSSAAPETSVGPPGASHPPASPGCGSITWSDGQEASVTGQGTIDVNPFAMVVTADIGSGLQVSVRANGTDYWELGAGDSGLVPVSAGSGSGVSTGSPLSGFAGLTESTLGTRQGAIAMLGLASPTGYLDLDQSEVTSASQVGAGTVDGNAVTIYQVEVTPAQEAQAAGATPEETKTITNALQTLQGQGYTGTTVKVSVDSVGYIRQSVSTANFSDGGTVTLSATFSNFGCAGTVLMPGQQGPSTPPAGCTSPVPTTPTVPDNASTSTTVTGTPSTTPGSVPSTIVSPPSSTTGTSTTEPTVAPTTSTTEPPTTSTTGGSTSSTTSTTS